MSDFVALSRDTTLWDPATRQNGGHTTWPSINNLSCVSDNAGRVECPFSGGGMGDVEKPQQDMAFLLMVPSITIRCKRVFGLTTEWAHPYQAHFELLQEVACRPVLLADVSTNWPYTLCAAEWCHIPCGSIKWRACQCSERWCAQHTCPWPASSATDM